MSADLAEFRVEFATPHHPGDVEGVEEYVIWVVARDADVARDVAERHVEALRNVIDGGLRTRFLEFVSAKRFAQTRTSGAARDGTIFHVEASKVV